MHRISVRTLGLAFGITCALLYIGCVVLMFVVGHDGTVFLLNSTLHGLDVTSFVKTENPFLEWVMGVAVWFVLGWLTGVCVAAIYNMASKAS